MIKLTPEKPPYYEIVEPVKIYKALMTQTGTNDPIPTILYNTLGEITWTRLTDGQYQGLLTGAFPLLKTAPLAQERNNGGSTLLFRIGDNGMGLQTSIGGSYFDGLLVQTYIEISVYQ